ncbi:MAG: sigma 54-interacting transcriptional regulator [Candidatus Rokubacteria bacterium]|nr:sigma 54-interacting transcriptional regulator [Candidatus Rokubacteria bacterium]
MFMTLLDGSDRQLASAISRLAYANPFLPERIEYEREALGAEFVPGGTLWNSRGEPSANMRALHERSEALAGRLSARLAQGVRPSADDLQLYEDVVIYFLFSRYEDDFYRLIEERAPGATVSVYRSFRQDVERLLQVPRATVVADRDVAHVFAIYFQIRRAFHYIFRNIIGSSAPVIRLRAAVWQSIFTRDMRRYRRSLYQRMGDVATLIVGPSGTGKELVARAIGLARYVPFDGTRQTFTEDFAGSFHALNPSALSPTLIESELFGHRRGAFTGALADRAGWLEVCPPLGSVFLDEIGELDPAIQVKLLRVLQERTFQRLGDTRDRHFQGKIIAATNRDLAREMLAGRFRQDFYYRLCSDLIVTPSLEEQLRAAPGERGALVRFIAGRVAGEAEAESLAAETERWIDAHLGPGYAWPGNVRELEQCVRNVMIRGEYRPPRSATVSVRRRVADEILAGSLAADDVLRRYCTLVYAETGSFQETGRRLQLDRRTVREKIDQGLLAELRGEA